MLQKIGRKPSCYLNLVARMTVLSLLVFFVIRLLMFTSYPEYFSQTSSHSVFMAFIYGIRFDLTLMIMVAAPSLLWLIIPLDMVQRPRIRQFFAVLYGIALALSASFYLGDVYFFGEIKQHLSTEILNIGINDAKSIAMLAIEVAPIYTAISITMLGAFLVFWWKIVVAPSKVPVRTPKNRINKILTLSAMLFLLAFIARGATLDKHAVRVVDAYKMLPRHAANLALNGTYVVARRLFSTKKLVLLNDEDYSRLNTYYSHNEHASLLSQQGQLTWQKDRFKTGKLPKALTGKPKNVVILLLESWSRRYIDGLSGTHYNATPFLDKRIKHSMVFDRMYAAGHGSQFGLQSVLSSIPVLHNYATLGFGLENIGFSRMGLIAKNHGYATILGQSSARVSFNVDVMARNIGFDDYFGKEDVKIIKQYPDNVPYFGWDYDTLMHLKRRLDQQSTENPQQPFISFVFTGTTHTPFFNPGETFHVKKHSRTSENGFLNTLRYSDWAIEQFIQKSKDSSWYENTVFIFLADHTVKGFRTPKDLEDQFRIPLILFAPDGSLPVQKKYVVTSQYDILPTVLDLIQAPETIATFGRSLFDDSQYRLPYATIAIGSVYGVINQKGWASFSGTNNLELHSSEQDVEDMTEWREHARWRLQNSDQLLRDNRWSPTNAN